MLGLTALRPWLRAPRFAGPPGHARAHANDNARYPEGARNNTLGSFRRNTQNHGC
jgi:hypothetical protein